MDRTNQSGERLTSFPCPDTKVTGSIFSRRDSKMTKGSKLRIFAGYLVRNTDGGEVRSSGQFAPVRESLRSRGPTENEQRLPP